jgi:hypothetical protein
MTDLVDDVDKAAGELLKRAMAADKDESGTPTLVTLTERTKAFDSVVEWTKVRHALAPPERAPSKFEQIKGAFDGTAGTRKTNKRRGTSDEDENEVVVGRTRRDGEAGDKGTASGSSDLNGADGLFAT